MSLARSGQRGATRRRGAKPGRIGTLVRHGTRALSGIQGGRMRPKFRKSKGITGTELRGFNRVSRLLGKFGMVPRKLRGARLARKGR